MSLILLFFRRVLEKVKTFCIVDSFTWFTLTDNNKNTYFIARYRLKEISFPRSYKLDINQSMCFSIHIAKVLSISARREKKIASYCFWLNASTNKSQRLAVAIFKEDWNYTEKKMMHKKGSVNINWITEEIMNRKRVNYEGHLTVYR